MWVESAGVPGQGSTFHLTIATRAAAEQVAANGAGAGPGTLDLDPEHAAGHPLRILLVEDNAVNQKLAIRLLSRMGYEADVAGNGLEAVEAVGASALRPRADGRADAGDGRSRGHPPDRRPRCRPTERPWIVAMTANAMDGDRERCIEAGMNGYISKPIRVEELVAAVLGTPSPSR